MPVTDNLVRDQMAETLRFYDEHATDYAAATLTQSMERWLTPFVGELSTGCRVADLGCGAGRDLKFFGSLGLNCVGVDRSQKLATIAKANSKCPVVVGDLRSLPVADGVLSGAWAAASILHLPRGEFATALAEIARVLKSGGIFFVSLKRGKGEIRDHWNRLFTLFEAEELLSALGQAHFDVLATTVDRRQSTEGDWGIGEWISCTATKQ